MKYIFDPSKNSSSALIKFNYGDLCNAVQYHPEFFLRDLQKVFRYLKADYYFIKTTVGDCVVSEMNETGASIGAVMVHTRRNPRVKISITVEGRRFTVKINTRPLSVRDVFNHFSGSEIFHKIAWACGREGQLKPLMADQHYEEWLNFADLSEIMERMIYKEAVREVVKQKGKLSKDVIDKHYSDILGKQIDLQFGYFRQLFTRINLSCVTFYQMFVENRLNEIPDTYPRVVIKDVKSAMDYAVWKTLERLKKSYLSEDRLTVAVLSAVSSFLSHAFYLSGIDWLESVRNLKRVEFHKFWW